MRAWHRHLEGWELAVVVVGSALVAAAIGVPRATLPREIPLPVVDRTEEARAEAERARRVDLARTSPLPFRVRAVGEALRRYGVAEAGSDPRRTVELAAELVAAAKSVRAELGDEPLLTLRAAQTDLFVRAVTRWAPAEAAPADVVELGGRFAARARKNGWIQGGAVVLEPDGVASLFEMRWAMLLGLSTVRPFSPKLNDIRLYFRTLIAHPEVPSDDGLGDPAVLAGYVTSLCRRDPDYPELLARGILLYRLGDFVSAEASLREHLRRNPEGPWWLRARNYLIAAHDEVPQDEP
ncbi:MAG TPA: hypothetical protein VHE30_26805 [Polyangiaceae bacterium]|nr:hypothetical protein [Polyangiaceae bacterium]